MVGHWVWSWAESSVDRLAVLKALHLVADSAASSVEASVDSLAAPKELRLADSLGSKSADYSACRKVETMVGNSVGYWGLRRVEM